MTKLLLWVIGVPFMVFGMVMASFSDSRHGNAPEVTLVQQACVEGTRNDPRSACSLL